jgi:Outer membrane protein beta-barrel domain
MATERSWKALGGLDLELNLRRWRKEMKIKYAIVFGAILLLGVVACAQEYPKGEVGFDYSYARYAPSASYTKGHSLNGGGGWAVYNFNEYIGVKMDLQGYGSNHTGFVIPPSTKFPGGGTGNVQGNLFTYLFGPQIKVRAHGFQPFGHLLLGGAHSNVYGNAFKTICQPVAGACAGSKSPAGDAFALAFGGGVDIPINKVVSIRPAEIDYLYTRFTNQFTNAGQNNFRYSAGVNFSFGNTSHN